MADFILPENDKSEVSTSENTVETNGNENADKTLTKSQIKKKLKLEMIYKKRIEKRKKERESRKLKRIVKKQNLENGELTLISRNKLKKNTMANSKNKLRVVVDCSFEKYMSDNDISHLCKQLTFCYAANRRMEHPLQLYITDYKSKLKEILDKMGAENWDVHKASENYIDLFSDEIAKGDVCYLTSDSPNVLETFEDNKVYIIGGLVDHNHHKSLCYNLALGNNIKHCQLPIGKYLNMKSRQVLTVNQVYELMCNFKECNDWEKSFMLSLPKRKGAEVKATKEATTDVNHKNSDDNLEKSNSTNESCLDNE